MNKAKMRIGVGELKKVFDSCNGYALAVDYVGDSVCGYIAEGASKDTVLDAVRTLRKEVAETMNIYEQIEHACKSIEDSIKED